MWTIVRARLAALWAFIVRHSTPVALAAVGVGFLIAGWLGAGEGGFAAGSALLAIGVTNAVDVHRQRQADAARAAAEELDRRRRDLDETFRLLGMMDLAARNPHIRGQVSGELVVTIANALANHSRIAEYDEAIDHCMEVLGELGVAVRNVESLRWVQDRMAQISAAIRDLG